MIVIQSSASTEKHALETVLRPPSVDDGLEFRIRCAHCHRYFRSLSFSPDVRAHTISSSLARGIEESRAESDNYPCAP